MSQKIKLLIGRSGIIEATPSSSLTTSPTKISFFSRKVKYVFVLSFFSISGSELRKTVQFVHSAQLTVERDRTLAIKEINNIMS